MTFLHARAPECGPRGQRPSRRPTLPHLLPPSQRARRSVALATAMWLGTPSFVSAQQSLSIPFEKFTLPNGLEVILHLDKSVPIVAVNGWYKVGSGDELPGRTGFAHLFEHIMFMG